MKIELASDLHLEFVTHYNDRGEDIDPLLVIFANIVHLKKDP